MKKGVSFHKVCYQKKIKVLKKAVLLLAVFIIRLLNYVASFSFFSRTLHFVFFNLFNSFLATDHLFVIAQRNS